MGKRSTLGLTKGEMAESAKKFKQAQESGMLEQIPFPHAFVAAEASDNCICGRKITDGLHQLSLFE
jgi:hypothetical protein